MHSIMWSDFAVSRDIYAHKVTKTWKLHLPYSPKQNRDYYYYGYYYYCRFTALCPGLLGWAGTKRNIHPLTYPDHHQTFYHLLPSTTIRSVVVPVQFTVLDNLFCTTSLHGLCGLPLGLEPSISYSIHFFSQSVSSFRSTCPYHCNLFCCSINIISSVPSLSLSSLLGTL